MSKKKTEVNYYIYKTICLTNGKIYIGRRKCNWPINQDGNYIGSGTIFRKSVKLHGKENFIKTVIEVSDKDSYKERETYWINYFNATDRSIGYNITEGGSDGDGGISNHPNKTEILSKRSRTWKERYWSDADWQARRKNQLNEIRSLIENKAGAPKVQVVKVDIGTGLVLRKYDSISIAEKEENVTGISLAINRNGLCGGMYFRRFVEGKGYYGIYKKPEIDYGAMKGRRFSVSTEFKKGHIPPFKGVKGVHLSPNTEFKKGNEAWNKGAEYSQIKGRNHFASVQIVALKDDYSLYKTFDSISDARKDGYYFRGINRSIAKSTKYKNLFWMREDQYNYVSIDSIEYIDEIPEHVYNLEIEGNNNYFVNGILTHNCDDPQNPKKAHSEVERASAISRWNETISNRLNQLEIGGRVIVMQRLHEQDLVGYLLNPKTGRPDDIRHICIPAEYDPKLVKPEELKVHYHEGKYFWKTRFSEKVLSVEKKKGPLYFAGQFQQTPVPPEGNLFKRKWFDIIDPAMISRSFTENPIHFFIDTAYTEDETEKNDPTGIIAVFFKDNYIYIVNFIEVWLEFPDLIKFIKEYVAINGYTQHSGIFVEPKASGISVVQQLKVGTGLNVMEIEGEYLRDDKVTRANGVSPIAMARRIKVVEGPWNEAYLSQLTSFPKAQHDEAVDVTVYAANYLIPSNEFLSASL